MAVRDVSVSACLSNPRINLLSQTVHHCYMSRHMTKPTKLHVRPANTQISLGIRPDWSESWLGAHSFCWFCHEAAHISNSPAAVTSGLSDLRNPGGYRGDATAGKFAHQELLLQRMFLGCNWIYKHFVETKKHCVQIFRTRTFTAFFFFLS